MRCLLQKLIRYWIEIQSNFFCFKFNLQSLLLINTMLYTDKRTIEIKEGITERINNAWRFTTFGLILQKRRYLLLTLRGCAEKSLLHTMQKFQRGSFCTFIQFFFLFFCFFVLFLFLFLFFCFVLHQGLRNDFKAAMERVDQEYLAELIKQQVCSHQTKSDKKVNKWSLLNTWVKNLRNVCQIVSDTAA